MSTKVIAVALAVVLTTVGGAAAVTTTGGIAMQEATDSPTGEADVDATYDGGTVTVTVTRGGDPVPGAVVEVADGEYATDANGTVVARDVAVEDELTVEVEADGFEGEVEYERTDGNLTISKEEYEYEAEDESGEDDDERDESEEDESDEKESEEDESEEDESGEDERDESGEDE